MLIISLDHNLESFIVLGRLLEVRHESNMWLTSDLVALCFVDESNL